MLILRYEKEIMLPRMRKRFPKSILEITKRDFGNLAKKKGENLKRFSPFTLPSKWLRVNYNGNT